MYVTRASQPGKRYLIHTVLPQAVQGLVYIHVLGCNGVADLLRFTVLPDPDDDTAVTEQDILYHSGVYVSRTVKTRTLSQSADGLKNTAFYSICLPCSYAPQIKDKVSMADGIYRVESIDNTLEGIVTAQLSYCGRAQGAGA